MSADLEILKDFINESKNLIKRSSDILDKVEGDMSLAQELDEYGNLVDRIMGGAQSIALALPPEHALHLASNYAALCKVVGYKTAQITNNEQFFNICVALLQDATETLEKILNNLEKHPEDLKKIITDNSIERLRWIAEKFNSEYQNESNQNKEDSKHLNQNEIDTLMKKMGF